jgi:hypothetical protein
MITSTLSRMLKINLGEVLNSYIHETEYNGFPSGNMRGRLRRRMAGFLFRFLLARATVKFAVY